VTVSNVRLKTAGHAGWVALVLVLVLGLWCASGVVAAEGAVAPAVTAESWVVFASADCEECKWFKAELLPRLRATAAKPLPSILFVDLDAEGGYDLLVQVERALNSPGGDQFPAFLRGAKLSYGKDQIAALEPELAGAGPTVPIPEPALTLLRSCPLVMPFGGEGGENPEVPVQPPAQPLKQTPPASVPNEGYRGAQILYFTTPGCKACSRAAKQAELLVRRFAAKRVHTVDTLTPEGRVLQMAVATYLELPASNRLNAPMFVSGSAAVFGKTITDASLEALFAAAPDAPFWYAWDEAAEFTRAVSALKALTHGFTVPAVLVAGLVDGVNPCAFAVILFLVSYLTLTGGMGRRQALGYGLAFCAGVFICYLLIGLGFVKLLHVLQQGRAAFRVVLVVTGILCLGFAAAAGVDVIRARRYGPGAMQFGMPKAVKALVHSLIRENVGRGFLLVSAFVLGVAVSGLELVCTGQIYLPAIIFMNSTAPGAGTLGLLLLYNVMFILPLLAVVFLGVYGLGSKRLGEWGRQHAVLMRLLVGIVVLVLGVAMLVLAFA